MITYKWKSNSIVDVLLENKVIGKIKPVDGGFAYYPKGSKESGRGEICKTINLVKQTLEQE